MHKREEITEQDKEAYVKFIGENHPCSYDVYYNCKMKDAWQAACEYKDKQHSLEKQAFTEILTALHSLKTVVEENLNDQEFQRLTQEVIQGI